MIDTFILCTPEDDIYYPSTMDIEDIIDAVEQVTGIDFPGDPCELDPQDLLDWLGGTDYSLCYIGPEIKLLLDGCRGIYIPRDFAEEYKLHLFGLDPESWEVKTVLDPEHDDYWEAWDWVMSNAEYKDDDGTWHLHQNGDLWLVPDCYPFTLSY